MADYTIYKTATGDITTCGTTNLTVNDIILESDESIIEGMYEAEKYKIIDGAAVEQTLEEDIRTPRNVLLAESDWTQLPDSPLTDAKKAEWAAYRSALRSLPDNTTDPANPTWPSKPS